MKEPDSPSVPMSEPVEDRKKAESIMEMAARSDTKVDIHPERLESATEMFMGVTVKMDEDGFLVNEDGDYYKPYCYSEEKTKATDEPEGPKFEERYHNLRFSDDPKPLEYSLNVERVHIRDAYGFMPQDGDVIVIYDNSFDIAEMYRDTGLNIKYQIADDLEDAPEKPDEMRMNECDVCGTDYYRDQEMPEEASIYWVPSCPYCEADVTETEPDPWEIGNWLEIPNSKESSMWQRAHAAARHLHDYKSA